jgi:dolichol-phosphate mannosyltransferase
MPKQRKVYILVPVFNEELNIPELVNSWRKISKELNNFEFFFILVDDGSTDKTAQVALEISSDLNLKLLQHKNNKGPGYAFGTGFEYLATIVTAEDIIVTIEGDNTSMTETLKIMLGRIMRENVDVSLASPLSYGGAIKNTNWYKTLLAHISSALTKIFLDIRGINTFTSFFRAYQGHVILQLQKAYGLRILEFSGFECMVELLKKIVMFEFSISEVPMKLDTSLRKGKSKLKIIKTAISYFHVFISARKWKRDKHSINDSF